MIPGNVTHWPARARASPWSGSYSYNYFLILILLLGDLWTSADSTIYTETEIADSAECSIVCMIVCVCTRGHHSSGYRYGDILHGIDK